MRSGVRVGVKLNSFFPFKFISLTYPFLIFLQNVTKYRPVKEVRGNALTVKEGVIATMRSSSDAHQMSTGVSKKQTTYKSQGEFHSAKSLALP